MPRKPRNVIPNVAHHVTQRGNRRQQTFFCDGDYQLYIDLLALGCERFQVVVLGYCLMPNHVHLVVVPSTKRGLTLAIKFVHENYTRIINERMNWKGHFWQGRYYSNPLDEHYLATTIRYVEMNPVAAKICDSPTSYKWSSARAHFEGKDDRLVKVAPLLAMFPDWEEFLRRPTAQQDIELISKHVTTGRALGSKLFFEAREQSTQTDSSEKEEAS